MLNGATCSLADGGERVEWRRWRYLVGPVEQFDADGLSNELEMRERWKGVVIALGTGILVSLIYLALKFCNTTSIHTVTFWQGVSQALVSICFKFFVGFGSMPAGAYVKNLLRKSAKA